MRLVSLHPSESKSNVIEEAESHQVLVSLGSNIDPEENLERAAEKLRERTILIRFSNVWQTPPYGGHGSDFLNATALIQTPLSASDLKENVLHLIENELGRKRTEDPNAPRTIDLDILVYDGIVLDDSLWTLPHLCIPTSELAPDLTQPISGKKLISEAKRLIKEYPIKKHMLNLHRGSTP